MGMDQWRGPIPRIDIDWLPDAGDDAVRRARASGCRVLDHWRTHGSAYDYLIAIVFASIGACGRIVFLWDIDRAQDRCADGDCLASKVQ